MKENYTTDAINLKSYVLSEADKIVLMYSKDKGLIKGVAKGAKKIKSKLGGRMELFIANKLLLNKGKNLDTICQAEAINTFSGLRNNMDKLLYSSYIAEIISIFGYEGDYNSEQVYDVFYKALNKISGSECKTEILLNVIKFQLKIMDLVGYKPSLTHCIHCGCDEAANWYFSTKSGGIICKNCASHAGSLVKFQHKLKDFLYELGETGFDEKSHYEELANEKVCSVCFNLLKDYIKEHSEKDFKTTKILETV